MAAHIMANGIKAKDRAKQYIYQMEGNTKDPLWILRNRDGEGKKCIMGTNTKAISKMDYHTVKESTDGAMALNIKANSPMEFALEKGI